MADPLPRLALPLLLAAGLSVPPAAAQVSYSITDGAADVALGIDRSEGVVLLNTFPVDPNGSYIDQILIAYGRVGGPSLLNGRPVRILLYEDVNGGSPQDALLLWSLDTTIANGNTNVLNVYNVPRLHVTGTLVAGYYFYNSLFTSMFIGPLDTSEPTLLDRSWWGYATSIDPAHLENIPTGQWGNQESSTSSPAGNYRIEVRGQATDGIALSLESHPELGVVRLTWTGSKPSYVLERASSPSFADAQVLASGAIATYDDPALGDGATWYYRAR